MEIPLQITYKGIERSPTLDRLIRKRVSGLSRFHNRVIGCRVVVTVPHRAAETAKVPIGISVEVEVPAHSTIVGRDVEERRDAKGDHLTAVNRAFEAVERQLAKLADVLGREVKAHEADGESGLVVRLFPDQGYGFIEVKGSPELYFTRNAVSGGSFDDLAVGTVVHVTRATTEGPMGPQASSVRLLGAPRSSAL